MTNLRNFVPRKQRSKVRFKLSKLAWLLLLWSLNEAIIAIRTLHYELTVNDTAAIAQDLLRACETKLKLDEIDIILQRTGRTSGNAGYPFYRENDDLTQRYQAFLEILNLTDETCKLERQEELLAKSRNPNKIDEITLIGILIQNNRTKIDERIAVGEEGKERFNYPLNSALYPGVEIHYISRFLLSSLSAIALGWKFRDFFSNLMKLAIKISVRFINWF